MTGTFRIIEEGPVPRRQATSAFTTGLTIFSGILIGLVVTYWATQKHYQERILESGYDLLFRVVGGPPEKKTTTEIAEALEAFTATRPPAEVIKRINEEVARLAIPITKLEIPREIEGVPIGVKSKVVPELPPVGAVLPMAEVIEPGFWKGGQHVVAPWIEGGVELTGEGFTPASREDIEAMPEIMTKMADKFVEEYWAKFVSSDDAYNMLIAEYASRYDLRYDEATERISDMSVDEIIGDIGGIREALGEPFFEMLNEYLMENRYAFEDVTIRGTEYQVSPVIKEVYRGFSVNMNVVNQRTHRSYTIDDLDDLFAKAIEGKSITEDDINYATLWVPFLFKGQTDIEREMQIAASQIMGSAAPPGTWDEIAEHMREGDTECEAWDCYKPPRSIMDPNLQIVKAMGNTEEVDCINIEAEVPYSCQLDYCYVFADSFNQLAKDNLRGKTWTKGNSWDIDVCGIHVTIEGQEYTIPPDEILEWSMSPTQLVPKYLTGRVCAAYSVVTPAMLKEMEKVALTELETIRESEPREIFAAASDMATELSSDELTEFVTIYEQLGREEALKALNKIRALQIGRTGNDIRYEWNDATKTLDLDWKPGEKIDRGHYKIDLNDFGRFILDVGKGRMRRTIRYMGM